MDIYYGDLYWVAVGYSGVIRYISGSDPSGTWSGATSGLSTNIRNVGASNTHWCAVGDSGEIIYKS